MQAEREPKVPTQNLIWIMPTEGQIFETPERRILSGVFSFHRKLRPMKQKMKGRYFMNFSKTKKNSSSKQSLGGQKIVPILFLASLLVIWELACKLFSIPLYVLPSPMQVIQSLFTESATLSHHAAVTVMEAVIGILLSLILAIVLGILMDCFPLVRQGIYPLLVVTQTVPMIVLAPILIIYMGFGIAPKILTVILMCFFPIAVSFSDGLAQVDEEYVHLVRSYGASRLSAYRLVKIPAAIPALLSGLKVSATYSISGAVVGEWIGAQEGLGYYLLRVKNGYMLDRVFACVLIIIILSLCMNGLIRIYQHFALPYLKNDAN